MSLPQRPGPGPRAPSPTKAAGQGVEEMVSIQHWAWVRSPSPRGLLGRLSTVDRLPRETKVPAVGDHAGEHVHVGVCVHLSVYTRVCEDAGMEGV